jgi:hypothetical protein
MALRLFLFADGLWVNGLQRFDKQPEYTEVNPGEDALMTCKVFNKKGSCSWQKDNKVGHDTKLLHIPSYVCNILIRMGGSE